jgi:hypothetical protein
MPSHKTMSAWFDASPARLVAVLTHPAFLVAQQQLDAAFVDAEVEELEREADRLVLVLRSTEYGRGLLGIDRSRTETSRTTYRWDLRAHRCEWTYEDAHGNRFEAGGTDRVEPDGEGARLTTEFRLDVRVPLIGRRIERFVLSEFESRQPKYEQVIRRFCAELP